MDDDAPIPRRTPRVLVISVICAITVLAGSLVWGAIWLFTRSGGQAPEPDHGPGGQPPDPDGDGGGGGTAPPDTPEPNEADDADGGDIEVDGCDGPTCEGPTCDTTSCDEPSCETQGGDGCETTGSGGGLIAAGVSMASVLPLVTVTRLTPRRRPRRRATATLPARCGLVAIRGYRRWISPRTRTRCRYVPSCSAYGATAIAGYGLATGSRFAVDRIRRCKRTVPMGTVDPPP